MVMMQRLPTKTLIWAVFLLSTFWFVEDRGFASNIEDLQHLEGDLDFNHVVDGGYFLQTKPLKQPFAKIASLKISGPKKISSGRKATWEVQIRNVGTQHLRRVRFRASGGSIDINVELGKIAPNTARTKKIILRAKKPGSFKIRTLVVAKNAKSTKAQKKILVTKSSPSSPLQSANRSYRVTAPSVGLETGFSSQSMGAPGALLRQLGKSPSKLNRDDLGTDWGRYIINWRFILKEGFRGQTKPTGGLWDHRNSAYDWSAADRSLRELDQAGLKIVVSLFSGPDWAQNCADPSGYTGTCMPNLTDLKNFALAAASRYNGNNTVTENGKTEKLPHVKFWLVWNEPNLPLMLTVCKRKGLSLISEAKSSCEESIDLKKYDTSTAAKKAAANQLIDAEKRERAELAPLYYLHMVNAVSGIIKGLRPENTVLAGSTTAKRGSISRLASIDFLRRMTCLENFTNSSGLEAVRKDSNCNLPPANFDIWAQHAYTPGDPSYKSDDRDDVFIGANLDRLSATLNSARALGRVETSSQECQSTSSPASPLPCMPIWITEISWENENDPSGVPNDILSHWISESFYNAWKRGGVSKVFWLAPWDWAECAWCNAKTSRILNGGLLEKTINANNETTNYSLTEQGESFNFPLWATPSSSGDKIFVWTRVPFVQSSPVSVDIIYMNPSRQFSQKVATRRSGIAYTGIDVPENLRQSVRNKNGLIVAYSMQNGKPMWSTRFPLKGSRRINSGEKFNKSSPKAFQPPLGCNTIFPYNPQCDKLTLDNGEPMNITPGVVPFSSLRPPRLASATTRSATFKLTGSETTIKLDPRTVTASDLLVLGEEASLQSAKCPAQEQKCRTIEITVNFKPPVPSATASPAVCLYPSNQFRVSDDLRTPTATFTIGDIAGHSNFFRFNNLNLSLATRCWSGAPQASH